MRLNKILTTIFLVFVALISNANFVFAQNSTSSSVNCRDSFAPRFVCDAYADLTNNLNITTIVRFILIIGIALLVIFVLFQIVKAVFSWIGKSNDDKARGAAIKSISNAVVGFIITVVLVIIVTFVAPAIGLGTPNPLYGCYPNYPISVGDLDPDTGTATTQSIVGNIKGEIPNTLVYEGKANLKAPGQGIDAINNAGATVSVNGTRDAFNIATGSKPYNSGIVDFMQDNLYCVDKNTGKEYPTGYIILKKVGVKKVTTTP